MNQSKREENRQLWLARICDLEDSGMTQEKWCKKNNISYTALRYWLVKLKKEAYAENQDTRWIKIDRETSNQIATLRIPDKEIPSNNSISVRIGDFTAELKSGCDLRQAYELFRMLKTL